MMIMGPGDHSYSTSDVPTKVRMASNFISQMRSTPPLGSLKFSMAHMGPDDDETDGVLKSLTKHEAQAYNAACFVLWGYFTGEMDYAAPPPADPSTFENKFGEGFFEFPEDVE